MLIEDILILIDQLTFDDRKILISKLFNTIYYSILDSCYYYAQTKEQAIQLVIKHNKPSIFDIHSSLFCISRFCAFEIDCNACKSGHCFICEEQGDLFAHLSTHTIDEVSDEILGKYYRDISVVDICSSKESKLNISCMFVLINELTFGDKKILINKLTNNKIYSCLDPDICVITDDKDYAIEMMTEKDDLFHHLYSCLYCENCMKSERLNMVDEKHSSFSILFKQFKCFICDNMIKCDIFEEDLVFRLKTHKIHDVPRNLLDIFIEKYYIVEQANFITD